MKDKTYTDPEAWAKWYAHTSNKERWIEHEQEDCQEDEITESQ